MNTVRVTFGALIQVSFISCKRYKFFSIENEIWKVCKTTGKRPSLIRFNFSKITERSLGSFRGGRTFVFKANLYAYDDSSDIWRLNSGKRGYLIDH